MKDSTTAAVLEFICGLLLCTFGVGHIYAGHVGRGLVIMLGWWIICLLNLFLMAGGVGLFTFPLCWLGALIVSPLVAAESVEAKA